MSFKKVLVHIRGCLLMSIDMTPGFKPFKAVLPKYANKNTELCIVKHGDLLWFIVVHLKLNYTKTH